MLQEYLVLGVILDLLVYLVMLVPWEYREDHLTATSSVINDKHNFHYMVKANQSCINTASHT